MHFKALCTNCSFLVSIVIIGVGGFSCTLVLRNLRNRVIILAFNQDIDCPVTSYECSYRKNDAGLNRIQGILFLFTTY